MNRSVNLVSAVLLAALAAAVVVANLRDRTGQPTGAAEVVPARWWDGDRPGSESPFVGLRLSADGRRLVAGSWGTDGGALRSFDLRDGSSVALYADRAKGVDGVPSPDGRWVVGVRGAEPDWQLVIWGAATGKEAHAEPVAARRPDDQGRLRVLGFDRGGGAWVYRPDRVIDRVEVPSGKVTRSIMVPFHVGGWGRLILSPGGEWLALGGLMEFAVRRTDGAADWQVVEHHPEPPETGCLPEPTMCPIPCGFSPDGRRLATYDRRRSIVAVWEVGNRMRMLAARSVDLTPWTHLDDLTFTPGGARFVFRYARAGTGRDAELRVWDAATLKEVGRVGPANGVEAFAVTPAGRLVLARPDGTLSVRDVPAP